MGPRWSSGRQARPPHTLIRTFRAYPPVSLSSGQRHSAGLSLEGEPQCRLAPGPLRGLGWCRLRCTRAGAPPEAVAENPAPNAPTHRLLGSATPYGDLPGAASLAGSTRHGNSAVGAAVVVRGSRQQSLQSHCQSDACCRAALCWPIGAMGRRVVCLAMPEIEASNQTCTAVGCSGRSTAGSHDARLRCTGSSAMITAISIPCPEPAIGVAQPSLQP